MGGRAYRRRSPSADGRGRQADRRAAQRSAEGCGLRRRPQVERGYQRVEPRGHDRVVQRDRRDDRLDQGGVLDAEASVSDDFDYPAMSRALILGDKETVARKTAEGLGLAMDPKDLI